MKALDGPRSAILTPLMFASRHNSRLDGMQGLVSGHLVLKLRVAGEGRYGVIW